MTLETNLPVTHRASSDLVELGFLPIQFFKEERMPPAGTVKTFRSSGTSSSSRSRSHFSAAGLEAYRSNACENFSSMMTKKLGPDWRQLKGLSLVPNLESWSDSSLAQMLSWISEEADLDFVTPDRLPGLVDKDEPVWLVGTAFHLIHACDREELPQLAQGSLVIETGGTKNKSRSMERTAYLDLLSRTCGLGLERIVSEYGMCELASQAYEIIDDASMKRRFRFSPEVGTRVAVSATIRSSGIGALVVDDPHRIDIGRPIRTQDMVQLEEDGSFELLGRIPDAPLKGCSLRAEQITPRKPNPRSSRRRPAGKRKYISDEALFASLLDISNDRNIERALARECGSLSDARECLKDTFDDLPEEFDDLRSQASPFAQTWLINLPGNHSIAAIYPIALGLALGLDLKVRVPLALSHPTSSLMLILSVLVKRARSQIELLGGDEFASTDAILAFGSDATIRDIRSSSGCPVQGFGHRVGATYLNLARPLDWRTVAKDCFSLAQKGCMSSRLLIASKEFDLELLRQGFRDFWQADLSPAHSCALFDRAYELRELGYSRLELSNDSPLIYARGCDSQIAPATHSFTLPVVFSRNPASLLTQVPGLSYLYTNENTEQWNGAPYFLRKLGSVHSCPWNGYHEDQMLFNSAH